MDEIFVAVLEMPDTSPRHCLHSQFFFTRPEAEAWCNQNEEDYEWSIVRLERT